MKRKLLVLSLCAVSSLAQRAANALVEADFIREECIKEEPVFRTSGIAGQGGNNFDMVSMGPGKTFDCPKIIFDDVLFVDASNGFNATVDGALISSTPFDKNIFVDESTDHSLEFFFFINEFEQSEPFTLLEIGRNAFGEDISRWDLGVDFFLRLGLEFQNNNGGTNVILSTGADILNAEIGITLDNSPNTLHHLVVNLQRDIGNQRVQATVFLDAAFVAFQQINGDPTITFGAEDVFMTLGMSFEAITNTPEEITMPIDLHKFALYDKSLSAEEVSGNLAESIIDSLPTTRPISLDHFEDTETTFTFDELKATFDFEEDILGINQAVQISILVPVSSDIGSFNPSGGTIQTDREVIFTQTVKDEDNVTGIVVFFAFQDDDTDKRSPVDENFEIVFQQSNDPPEAQDNPGFEVAELQVGVFELLATDSLDFRPDAVPEFLPQTFTIEDIRVDEIFVDGLPVPVGTIIQCVQDAQNNDIPVSIGDVFPVENSVNGEFTTRLCIRAAAFDGLVDAKVGDAFITYSVNDEVNSIENLNEELRTGTATVTVLQALFAGCRFLDEEKCEEVVNENQVTDGASIEIELQFFDSRCDEADVVIQDITLPPFQRDDAICLEREAGRAAIITRPLPDPVNEGVLSFENAAGEFEDITEELLDQNGGEFALPASANEKVIFTATDGYFNLSPFPLCNRITGERTGGNDPIYPDRGDCVNLNTAFDLLDCFGKFCDVTPAQSTGIELTGNKISYGECDVEIDDGCPVRIFSRLQILNGKSPPIEDIAQPAHIIWVNNTIERERVYEIFPSADEDLELQISNNIKLDPPFQIVDEDPNARICLITFAIDNGGEISIANTLNFDNDDKDAQTLLRASSNLEQGVGLKDPGVIANEMVGPSPIINSVIQNLEVTISEASTNIFIELQNPVRLDSSQGIDNNVFTVNGVEGNEEEASPADIFSSPYVIGSISFCCCTCCFICYKCFENDTCYCVYASKKVKLVVRKTAEGVGLKKRKEGSIDDEDAEIKSKSSRNERYQRRGKAKQKVAKSHRATEEDVTSKRSRPKDSDRQRRAKKAPPQSYRTNGKKSRRKRSDSSSSGESSNKPRGVYKNRKVKPPPRSHRQDH